VSYSSQVWSKQWTWWWQWQLWNQAQRRRSM